MNWESEADMAEDVAEHPELYEALSDDDMIIQVQTAGSNSNPTDYWDSWTEVTFTDTVTDTERTAYLSEHDTIEDVMESADYNRFIVKYEPEMIYGHPEADIAVCAYDGYIE